MLAKADTDILQQDPGRTKHDWDELLSKQREIFEDKLHKLEIRRDTYNAEHDQALRELRSSITDLRQNQASAETVMAIGKDVTRLKATMRTVDTVRSDLTNLMKRFDRKLAQHADDANTRAELANTIAALTARVDSINDPTLNENKLSDDEFSKQLKTEVIANCGQIDLTASEFIMGHRQPVRKGEATAS